MSRKKSPPSIEGEVETKKPKKSPSATADGFGWIFQTSAGLYLMLDNIENLQRLDMEGAKEDVEITLDDGSVIYAQAKSVVAPDDIKNVKAKLRKALSTLSACPEPINKLVYISNIPNPLLSKHPKHYEYATTHFDDFFEEDKKYIVDNAIAGFPTAKFEIINFKFYGKDRAKYSEIIKRIEGFLGRTRMKPALANRVFDAWQALLFDNSAEVGHMTKAEIVFPLILVLIETYDNAEDYERVCSHDLYYETTQKFASDIRDIPRGTEFYLGVIGDYQKAKLANSGTKITDFVLARWEYYKDEFTGLESDPQMLESLVKVVLLATLSRWMVIESVRGAVKLCL